MLQTTHTACEVVVWCSAQCDFNVLSIFCCRSPSDPQICHLWAEGQSSACVPQGYESHSFVNQHGHIRTVLSITSCLCQNWTLRPLLEHNVQFLLSSWKALIHISCSLLMTPPNPTTITFVKELAILKYYCIICNICKMIIL